MLLFLVFLQGSNFATNVTIKQCQIVAIDAIDVACTQLWSLLYFLKILNYNYT